MTLRNSSGLIPAKVKIDKNGTVRVFVNPKHIQFGESIFRDAKFTTLATAKRYAKEIGGKVRKLPGYGYAVVTKTTVNPRRHHKGTARKEREKYWKKYEKKLAKMSKKDREKLQDFERRRFQ